MGISIPLCLLPSLVVVFVVSVSSFVLLSSFPIQVIISVRSRFITSFAPA